MVTTDVVFTRLRTKLDALERLLQDLEGPDNGQQRHLVSRIAIEGRAITNILQNLRGPVGRSTFDRWYAPFQTEMVGDPLMRYFVELRNKTLKEGDDGCRGISASPVPGAQIKVQKEGIEQSFVDRDGSPRVVFQAAPPNAVRAFFADATGCAGWHVTQPDGTVATVYATIAREAVEVDALLESPPRIHLGTALPDSRPTTLCRAFVRYLRNLVQEAHRIFHSAPPS